MLLKKAGTNYTLYTTWYRTALMLATLEINSFEYKFHMNISQHTDYFIDGMRKLFNAPPRPDPSSVINM